MVKNNQSFTIKLEPASIREIERLVDLVCDQLFINDTYYGSILISLTEMFSLLLKEQETETFKIKYNTDYQEINFEFTPITSQIITEFESEIRIDSLHEEGMQTSIFLINSLVDSITVVDNNGINFSFDISALHNKIYKDRVKQLDKFFDVEKKLKVKKDDDQL